MSGNGFGRTARWPAPAKLNLFLHVLGRRPDGRHQLQTLFQLLDFGDELDIRARADGRLVLHDPLPGVPLEQDLCWRAAALLREASGTAQGADIHLRKRIPLGGGLGGGSSDAATCLVVLNRLWGLNWPLPRLAALGLQLGADVPVFVHGRTAFAEGVGEILQPLEQPETWYLVVTPDCPVSTAEIFAAPELTRDTPPLTISDLLAQRADLRNDCWPVVAGRYPAVKAVFEHLSRHGRPRLSGTGASVFLNCATRPQALAIQATLPGDWQALVARGLNTSPLLQAVAHSTTGV